MSDRKQQEALLERLQQLGTDAALGEAGQLKKLYHDRQMAGLSADVYDAAKSSGEPPKGWIRASEHPELLASYARSAGPETYQLVRAMHPDESGFRAEIYLPDSSVLGPGYKPVLAFKGSSGQVMTPDGLRDTGSEDFVANNFPQSVGLETDYYDRAMALARDLKLAGLDFELTGHSLAGGMASAASAVTGVEATTFNAAGLHPQTAKRFGEQNGLPVYDVSHRITAYQVQGELLSNGIQDNLHGMSANQRRELGGALSETCEPLTALPEARGLPEHKVMTGIPEAERPVVRAFIGKVATGDTDAMLRELPLAAGDVPPLLAPMTRLDPSNPNSPLLARNKATSLPELTYLAGPMIDAVRQTAEGANIGRQGGEVIAEGGRMAHGGLTALGGGIRQATDASGRVASGITHAGGEALQTVEHVAGSALAGSRELAAGVEARVDEGLGHARQWGASFDAGVLRGVGRWLPDGARNWMESQAQTLEQQGEAAHRQGHAAAAAARREGHADAAAIRATTAAVEAGTAQAASAIGRTQHDVIAGAGNLWAGALELEGRAVEGVSGYAPAGGAVVGGAAAGLPQVLPLIPDGALVAAYGPKAAVDEALGRHLMRPTVLPSLDKRIENVEQAARRTLSQAHAVAAPGLDHPDHPGYAMFQQTRAHVYRIDTELGRTPDQYSDNLSGSLAASAKAAGLHRVDAVALSDDGSRAFAAQHAVPKSLSLTAQVQTAQAIHTPLTQSGREWLAAAQAQAPAVTPGLPDPSMQRAADLAVPMQR